ncbi:ATP-binding cassette domain-containing protein [Acetobacteraceae bacterium]|nr:ATP-binding cassette domain-containing protein [Acetobacteraceae bacterium]
MELFSKKTVETLGPQDISLEMSHFSIFYKQTCVFKKDSFKTSLSGWTWLHGGNGSGKSTFIRAMLGLLPHCKGQLCLLGKSPQKARCHIGYMPQKREENALFLPTLSHVESAIPARFGFFGAAQRKKKAESLLMECGAAHLANRPLKVLSGGERQKVALAQAIAGDPALLILDEPFIALDHRARTEIVDLLLSLEKKRHIGIFLATHEGMDLLPKMRRDLYLREGSLFDVP